jgi:hypothetical protein
MVMTKLKFFLEEFWALHYQAFISIFLILGFILRLSLVFSSTNFDFESYKITSNLILNNVPPWQSQRYNYGISWSLVLGVLYLLSNENELTFRLLIIIVLSIADLCIFFILKRWFGNKTALIFFMNPVSIIITGHYNQFDNAAIAVGLMALYSLSQFQKSTESKYLVITVLLLSLSLTIKHNLALFLIWFLFSNFNIKIKLNLIIVPYFLFCLHFIPFMLLSKFNRESILSAVFKYWSSNNAPFWKFWFWNKEFAESLGDHTAWHHGRLWFLLMIFAVTLVGFFLRNVDIYFLLPAYSLALLIFSSAITSQFLVIASLGAAVFFNWGFAIFFVISTIGLLAEPGGFNSEFFRMILEIRGWSSWNTAPGLLLLGIVVHLIAGIRKGNNFFLYDKQI